MNIKKKMVQLDSVDFVIIKSMTSALSSSLAQASPFTVLPSSFVTNVGFLTQYPS